MKNNLYKMVLISFFVCLFFISCASTSTSVNVDDEINGISKSNAEIIDISVKTENIADSETTWLAPVVAEKLESNLSKYTDFRFINSANRKDIFKIQATSESYAFDENDAIEIGKLKNADYVLFTTLRKTDNEYTISVRLTNVTTGENKVSAILSNPRDDVKRLYSSNGCAVDEITVEICKALGTPLSENEESFLMKGELGLEIEEKQAVYDADVRLFNSQIEQLNREIRLVSSSTNLEDISKQEKLKAEKVLAEERLKLAKENQRRVAEELKQRKEDDLKNAERSVELKGRIVSVTEELNEKVQSVRNAKFENESLLGQIQVIELKKKAVIDIYNTILNERNNIYNTTLQNILDKKKEIEEKPYRAAELAADGKTPTELSLKVRKNNYNKTKKEIITAGQSDIEQVTGKLVLQKSTLLEEINNDYSKLNSRKISTLGNELIVTYGIYDGAKKGWPLYVTVKSDNIILFQTESFLFFEELTGKNPDEYGLSEPENYFDDVDFYNSLFLRGEPILIFELEYFATPKDVTKPSEYNFSFYNFKCYDTQTLVVNGNNLSSSKTNDLVLEDKNITRQMSPVCNLQPVFEDLPTLEMLIESKLEDISMNSILEKAGGVFGVRELPVKTNGSYGKNGKYVEFGNWPQTVKDDYVTIDTSETLNINNWTCYKGSDDCLYVKATATRNYYDSYGNHRFGDGDNKFSNGKRFIDGREYYFKMEPIKWRIIKDDYQGGKLLLAENVLVARQFDEDSNNYKNSEIRAWLNSDFINSAFSKEDIKRIKTVTVDNSFESSGRNSEIDTFINADEKYSGYSFDVQSIENLEEIFTYTDKFDDWRELFESQENFEGFEELSKDDKNIEKNIEDKIFLLSVDEAKKITSFLNIYIEDDKVRSREATDYSKATGLLFSDLYNDGAWWLRSSFYGGQAAYIINIVNTNMNGSNVNMDNIGIVPALTISF